MATATTTSTRHLAATSADGKQAWTVVMQPGQVFKGEQLWTVRVVWKHRYGTDSSRWYEANLSEADARRLANSYWTTLRDRHNGK